MSSPLAPDPRLPLRDLLLDPVAVGCLLTVRMGTFGDLDVASCERLRAKYRVGESLRVVYRVRVGGDRHVVSARMFADGSSDRVYQRAAATSVPSGPLVPVAHDATLDTVFWSFPNDHRLTNLAGLAGRPAKPRQLLGQPWLGSELVAYAPEKSATARCLDGAGRTLAYVKAYARPEAGRHQRVLERVARHPATAGRLRVPSVVSRSGVRRMIWLEALPGRSLGALDPAELAAALPSLAVALAMLHRLPTTGLPRFGRFDLARLHGAAEVVGRARPELAGATARLAAALSANRPPAGEQVHLHGDVHPRNVLVDGGRLALIDLDQAGAGPRAADLGSVLARLRHQRTLGLLDSSAAALLAADFLRRYAEAAPLPAPAELAWYTAAALLAERALRAVNRVVEPALGSLGAVVEEAAGLLADRDAPEPMELGSRG